MAISYAEALKNGWIAPKDVPKSAKGKGNKREIEGLEQAELIKEFKLRFPAEGPLLIHIPNGGSRKNAYEGWRLKEQGVRAGVSDLFLPVARGGYFGLWIEFKAAPPNNAPISEAQQVWLDEMAAQGYHAVLCQGVSAAMAVLTSYLNLPSTSLLFKHFWQSMLKAWAR